VAKGRDRKDVLDALAIVSGQTFGDDPAAWKALAGGADPGSIPKKPAPPAPTIFGEPIYGERVIVCLENSLRTSDPIPFDNDRLRQICETKEGKPIVWFKAKTYGLLAAAHVKHLVDSMEKGTKIEILAFHERVKAILGKLSPVNAGTRKTVDDSLDALTTDDGIATFTVLNQALDTPSAAAAWKSGPDEIILITVNTPTKGEITDSEAIASAIALKARLRMVTIHTVGLGFHPYDMCRALAEKTGGIYVNLTK
jgi:uncharacterized membrane protein